MTLSFAVFPGLDAIFKSANWERWLDVPEVKTSLEQASVFLSEKTGEREMLDEFLLRSSRPHVADFDRTLVALTALQVGISNRVTKQWDFDGLVSCSHGDFARLISAGAISMQDAVDLLWHFAELRQRCPAGVTALTNPDHGDFTEEQLAWLTASGVTISRWSPSHATISGLRETISQLRKPAREWGLKVRPLLPYPVHSPIMKPAVDELLQSSDQWSVMPPKLPIFSSVGLEFLPDADAIVADFVRGALSSVRWMDAILTLVRNHEVTEFVNIGPNNLLISWAFELEELKDVAVVDAWEIVPGRKD